MSDEDGDQKSVTSDDDSSNSDGGSEPELMVTTRERRKTAGNRYTQIVGQEQEEADDEDDVALLFAEGDEGEDEEYNSQGEGDDADMSSSDDDDQGPNAAADDLEGEKELQNQAKVERQKKRKADLALTSMAGIKKRVKIDPTALHRAPERLKPSKRKDRESWLPQTDAVPGRTSSRKQTMAHREETNARLKENEEQRLKLKAQREEKERRRQANAPKEMTQADRLAEAERVERRNAKSLNRWEAKEKERIEEQAARLAALKDRKLEGPVVTLYSSRYTFKGPKPEIESGEEPKKRGPKPKLLPEPAAIARPNMNSSISQVQFVHATPVSQASTSTPRPIAQAQATPQIADPVLRPKVESEPSSGLLAGIHEFAVSPPTPQVNPATPISKPASSAPAVESTPPGSEPTVEAAALPIVPIIPKVEQAEKVLKIEPTTLPTPEAAQAPTPEAPVDTSLPSNSVNEPLVPHATDSSSKSDPDHVLIPENPIPSSITPFSAHAGTPVPSEAPITLPVATQNNTEASTEDPLPAANVEPPPLIKVVSTRNLVILDKMDELSAHARDAFNVFQAAKKSTKASKHTQEICVLTGLPVRYRDPSTGVKYANIAAFRKLKQLRQHQYRWSPLLGCYTGRVGHAAKGVPDGFLGT